MADSPTETGAGESGRDRLARLLSVVGPDRPTVVQAHDYPDIDAVASAWALASLLERRGCQAQCTFHGQVRSRSLGRLIEELGIVVSSDRGSPDCRIIVVDGSPSNGNVSLVDGQLAGVLDHHFSASAPTAPFIDIRPELASCSTLIFGYWAAAGEDPPRGVATALLAGIQSDTDFLSRRASIEDYQAYTALFELGDWDRASRIVRTALDLRELGLIARALENATVRDGALFAALDGPCGQEALAVLAEFVIRAEELRAAAIVSRDEVGAHISVRSKSPALSAFALVRGTLAGLGTGGGHSHSAGGLVAPAADPGDEVLKERFFAAAAAASIRLTEVPECRKRSDE
ncbi:MAG: DHH family phosphoesterase [Spirochaetaceae bacterium]|nr:DHH family phosphoesterase [Spirochaetaceae bacterium]